MRCLQRGLRPCAFVIDGKGNRLTRAWIIARANESDKVVETASHEYLHRRAGQRQRFPRDAAPSRLVRDDAVDHVNFYVVPLRNGFPYTGADQHW